MNPGVIRELAAQALGATDLVPLTQGGQKLVFSGKIAGELVAVKVMLTGAGAWDPTVAERARREVELLTGIDSEFVVKLATDALVVPASQDCEEFTCWAEEWLSGDDLARHLGKRCSEEEIRRFIHDVARGLAEFHSIDVVHRDLSPNNIRRTDDGRFVIMDPGFARHIQRTQITQYGEPGTPGWLSPEHFNLAEVVPASDIFVLGVIAYVLSTGNLPPEFDGLGTGYKIHLMSGQTGSVLRHRDDLSPGLAQVIDRCLERQTARRYINGQELLEDLKEKGEWNA